MKPSQAKVNTLVAHSLTQMFGLAHKMLKENRISCQHFKTRRPEIYIDLSFLEKTGLATLQPKSSMPTIN